MDPIFLIYMTSAFYRYATLFWGILFELGSMPIKLWLVYTENVCERRLLKLERKLIQTLKSSNLQTVITILTFCGLS